MKGDNKMFFVGLVVGLFIGCFLGILVMACLSVAKEYDNRNVEL